MNNIRISVKSRKCGSLLLALILSFSCLAGGAKKVKIELLINKEKVVIELLDNPTATSFLNQLPITVDLEDYASIEKIFYPPTKLSKKNAPEGYKPEIGDVTCYGPWGNVAIFYKGFDYAKGLIPLGKVISGLEVLRNAKNQKITIKTTE